MMRSWLAGEGHGKEVAVLLTPRMVGIPALALLSHTRRGGRAVMAVGDVQRRNILENLRNTVVGLPVANHPQLMSEAVGGRKIVLRSVVFHHAGHDGVDLGVVGIGEEHRFDIGFLVADVDHAVLLLVGARQFVLLDRARKGNPRSCSTSSDHTAYGRPSSAHRYNSALRDPVRSQPFSRHARKFSTALS